ncbi:unnamed protein product [Closterium sp. Yama58-4]|nr:unnamed protein product [Closterium sp. Yama58-4]
MEVTPRRLQARLHVDTATSSQGATGCRYHDAAPPPSIPTSFGRPPPGNPAVLHYLHFVQKANSCLGSAETDINALLQLLMVPELAQKVLEEYSSCRELERFELNQLRGLGRGYSTVTFKVAGFPAQTLFFRNSLEAFADLFGDPRNAPGFVLKPRMDYDPESKERRYTTKETATWWHDAQLPGEGLKWADRGKRWASSGHVLLGNLPIPPAGMSSAQSTDLFHKAVELMLQPILESLKIGFMMKDPNGVEHHVVPMLYAWVCDFPESCKITCTLSGATNRPCSICYAHKDHLCAALTILSAISCPHHPLCNLMPQPSSLLSHVFT